MKAHLLTSTASLKKIVLAASIALAAISGSLTASAENLGDIMPLGDSITAGALDSGYRGLLYQKLTNDGHQFKFVGSSFQYSNQTLIDAGQAFHEGHPAYPIVATNQDYGLQDRLDQWIGVNGKSPDVILLLAGTNEMPNTPTATASQYLDNLIGSIYGHLPNVELHVASIPPMTFGVFGDGRVEVFNATIPGIVAKYESQSKDINFVDIHAAIDPNTDLSEDGIHPNASGYAKIADAWHGALTVPEPSSITLLLMSVAGLAGMGRFRKKRR